MGISKSQMKRIISVLINVGVKGHFSMQGMEVLERLKYLVLLVIVTLFVMTCCLGNHAALY